MADGKMQFKTETWCDTVDGLAALLAAWSAAGWQIVTVQFLRETGSAERIWFICGCKPAD
jgi:hypothetical protein